MTAAPNNSMQLEGKTILLGITGGIAAYKSCNIVRLLQKRGARVKVVMSEHATEFVGPLTFRALTNEPVAVGLFDDPSDPIHHISLAQEPDLIVVAPATANIIAKMASGIADDLISTTLLATPRPIVIAPAMNNGMWKAPATQANMATLRDRGVHVVGPGSGYLACGDVDTGRMSEPEDIVEAVCEVLNPVPQDLAGKRIVITAGPTHEPIDPVRFIGNRSSGKMGIALAGEPLAAALRPRLCWARHRSMFPAAWSACACRPPLKCCRRLWAPFRRLMRPFARPPSPTTPPQPLPTISSKRPTNAWIASNWSRRSISWLSFRAKRESGA